MSQRAKLADWLDPYVFRAAGRIAIDATERRRN
jgi:hypothetical protein